MTEAIVETLLSEHSVSTTRQSHPMPGRLCTEFTHGTRNRADACKRSPAKVSDRRRHHETGQHCRSIP